MKKWIVALTSIGLLTACGNGETDEEPEVPEEAEEEPEQEEIEELTFVPQVSDEEVDFVEGENEITDNILSFVDEHNEELGEAGEVSVDLSNEIIYPQDQSDLRGIVLVSNRSDEPVSNFGFDVTIESDEGTTFAEDQTVFLTEEHFGVLEPNTVMPVYVEVDPEYIEELAETTIDESGTATADNFVYDDEPDNISEEATLGYNPVYVAELAQAGLEEEEEADPAAEGEFELLLPEAETMLEENSSTLSNLQMITEQYAPMVREYEQDWMDIWTGMVTMDPETEEAIGYFMLVNDTGEDLQDITFTLSLQDDTNDVTVLENLDIQLSADEYGVWEDSSVMPFSVDIPEEAMDDIMVLMEQDAQGIPVVEDLEYETAE